MRSARLGAGEPARFLAERRGEAPGSPRAGARRASTSALPIGASSKDDRKRCSASLRSRSRWWRSVTSVTTVTTAVTSSPSITGVVARMVQSSLPSRRRKRTSWSSPPSRLAPVEERHHPPAVGVVDHPEEGLGPELVGVPAEQLGHAPVGEGGAAVGVDDPHAEVGELEQALVQPGDPGGRPVRSGRGGGSPAPLISTSAMASLVERSTTSQGSPVEPERRTRASQPGPPALASSAPTVARAAGGSCSMSIAAGSKPAVRRRGGVTADAPCPVPHPSCRAHLTVVLPQLHPSRP